MFIIKPISVCAFGSFVSFSSLNTQQNGVQRFSPYVHRVLHDRHVSLALGRGVDGELGGRDDEAFAQRQPHSFSQSVRESAEEEPLGRHDEGFKQSLSTREQKLLNINERFSF